MKLEILWFIGENSVMRTIVTGTVGLDKGEYLEKVRTRAADGGDDVRLWHIGKRMYAEAPDVAPGRILDLPLARLHQLRRSVVKDILATSQQDTHLIVNTHATFRWKHGLFPGFDFDQFARLDADIYVCMMDTVDMVHARLLRDHEVDHSLKDLLVWREEETLATELLMMGCSLWQSQRNPVRERQLFGAGDLDKPKFYTMAIGRDDSTVEMFYRLVFQPTIPKVYISFPMTHVADNAEIQAEIDEFRQVIRRHFTVFDPVDMEEYQLYRDARAASERGQKVIEMELLGEVMRFDVAEIMQVAGDIHAQLYARDFMLIDQADMIISYIPEMSDGKPGLSSGVERELQHAHEATKEVFVIWRPQTAPSPFITETATKVFNDTEAAIDYFSDVGYLSRSV
ncbi:MAG: AAA family ATPase [Planctomycetes bacterium]|nr:AAA family ATPase [Planctomycetota bacterium]